MNKNAKRVLLGITIPAAIAGAIVSGLLIYRNVNVKPVSVYPLEELAMTDVGEDMSVTSGSLSAEGLQKIFLSGTQTVSSVDVTEGQEVKKGDVLLSYDTTLTQLEVERARVKVGRLELELSQASRELEDLNNMQPHSTVVIEPGYSVEYKPSETPLLLRGSGTSENPYIYLFDEFDSITGSLMTELLSKAASGGEASKDTEENFEDDIENSEEPEAPEDPDFSDTGEEMPEDEFDLGAYDDGSVYVVIINREENALNAQVTAKHGVRIDVADGTITGLGFFEPYLPDDIEGYEEQPESYEEEQGSEYTQEELVKLRASKESEIGELKRNIALAKNEYEQKKLETDESVVRASIDGIVTKVRTPQDAASGSEAVVELSAGGAYFVTGTLSEFDLETVHIGDKVYVEAYSISSDGGGGSYEGEIVEISDKPAAAEDSFAYFSYGEGNSNVTYYPFKVKLSGDVNLRDDSYMDISYQPDSEASGGIYVMNAFIRRDGADSYIYVKGDNGLLEKRSVKIGKSLWGSYTQIRNGLKSDDYLAFPYGNDVKPGAKTKEGSPDELYGDMPVY